MRWFTCAACGHTVFFENVRCTKCGHILAYLPDVRRLSAIEPAVEAGGAAREPNENEPALFVALGAQGTKKKTHYRLCANSAAHGICNWAVPADDPSPLCWSCRLNDVVPDVTKAGNLAAWKQLEVSKRRLFYTLETLELPIESREERPNGLVFNFKADVPGKEKVFTGHNEGEIVINIAEADDPFREKLRTQLGEGYRTVLGHFRHEIGHYYWDRLIKDTLLIAPYRALFGDERASYKDALERHYQEGPPRDWPLHYISSYATMHPWEDWAETWAHYLHMVDSVESAGGLGLVLRPQPVGGEAPEPLPLSSLDADDFDELLRGWVPLTLAINTLNRSMGLADGYPFVLSLDVIEKLRFVHEVIKQSSKSKELQREVAERWNTRLEAVSRFGAVEDPKDAPAPAAATDSARPDAA